MSTSNLRGFTLIELLIVIAIILILIAIALPNFLEAQVRAKVTKVRGEIRTTAVALESYQTDWRTYPWASELDSLMFPAFPAFGTRGTSSRNHPNLTCKLPFGTP